jgi:hypothetical protein
MFKRSACAALIIACAIPFTAIASATTTATPRILAASYSHSGAISTARYTLRTFHGIVSTQRTDTIINKYLVREHVDILVANKRIAVVNATYRGHALMGQPVMTRFFSLSNRRIVFASRPYRSIVPVSGKTLNAAIARRDGSGLQLASDTVTRPVQVAQLDGWFICVAGCAYLMKFLGPYATDDVLWACISLC